MGADTNLLKGEVAEDPQGNAQKMDVERLLKSFLHALIEEQNLEIQPTPPTGEPIPCL